MKRTIFDRLLANEEIPMDDPDYGQVRTAVNDTLKLSVRLNQATELDEIRALLGEITGSEIDLSTTIFPPFYTNVGRHIKLGKNVFINHACSFLDLGGITIEDGVMIAPRVNISSESHPIKPEDRNTMIPKAVRVKQNAWIGMGASILPGVTIGRNSVVAAGAVVTKDVPDNVVVAGMPAKVIKHV